MTISELEKALAMSIDIYSTIMQTKFDENNNEYATPADIDALAQQVSYVFADFKDNIIEYLKSNT